ncbi:MAG: hypothetical protein WCV41_01560 [Patescibacteria group bacterium]
MLSWREVENNINQEMSFLEDALLPSPYHQEDPIKCNDCLFRQIAILIVGGRIKVKKIIYGNNSVWLYRKNPTPIDNDESKKHGAYWHYSMIKMIENYFKDSNYSVQNEPNLHYGKADLGIEELSLFIEIGTINIFKLYNNLFYMKNSKIVVIPSDNYFIEFTL